LANGLSFQEINAVFSAQTDNFVPIISHCFRHARTRACLLETCQRTSL